MDGLHIDEVVMLRYIRLKIRRNRFLRYSLIAAAILLLVAANRQLFRLNRSLGHIRFLIYQSSCLEFNAEIAEYLNPEDDCLVTHIRKEIHYPLPNDTLVLENKELELFSQFGQDEFVDELLRRRKGGFFVECGAGDGEKLSNTLFFERKRNWTGLLIEADPESFQRLKDKHRSAYLVDNCISVNNKAARMVFQRAAVPYLGGLVDGFESQHAAFLQETDLLMGQVNIQCYPLQSLLLALNRTHVDYFSLDIEGPELDVLKNFPWEKFTIDVITVEFRVLKPEDGHLGVDFEESARKYHHIRNFMLATGLYNVAGTLPKSSAPDQALDLVFMRKVPANNFTL